MQVFDVGFYDGSDTDYYLWKGADVVAFEANPLFAQKGAKRFRKEIDAGQLRLIAAGVGPEEGTTDFFVNLENAEWSTFYREAALNWGENAYEVKQVPCITPETLFEEHGVPDYLKVDIEGFDIHIARHLRSLKRRPDLVSFEASNRSILRELVLAGYDAFKLVDQGKVPSQTDGIGEDTYQFSVSNTGNFGDAAPGEWLSFENAVYLYLRFEGDLFGTSVPAGSWWDIHAGEGRQAEPKRQLDWMRQFIDVEYKGHCGLFGDNKPTCLVNRGFPADVQVQGDRGHAESVPDVITRLTRENRILTDAINELHASTSWRLTAPVRALRRAFMSRRSRR